MSVFMTETAAQQTSDRSAVQTENWSVPAQVANRYLLAAGITLPEVRSELIDAAMARLESADRSASSRVRGVRILACLERVLCERLGAAPGSDTDNPDTARRRLLFAVNPTPEAQLALLRETTSGDASRVLDFESLVRIPEVRERKTMARQVIDYRHFPFSRRKWVSERPMSRPQMEGARRAS